MRIAIEATLAQRRVLTGFGHYVVNLIRALREAAPENEYLLLHTAEEWTGPDFGPQFMPVSYLCDKSAIGILCHLNSVLKKRKADVFHATCTTGVPPDPSVPCVATIHDIYPLLYPHEAFTPPSALYRMLVKFSADGAARFIANSAFTASEFAGEYKIPASKIDVAHNGLSFPERLLSWPSGRPGNSYLLCVGAIERRKGQLLLLEAYRRVSERRPEIPPLKFIGPDRGDGEQLLKAIEAFDLTRKVEWLRYVSDNALAAYYRSASHFAFPSFYEGFGVPLAEAMAAGLPTLCSDIPVFHEIAGDYPLYAKPEPRAMAGKLDELLFGEQGERFLKAPRRHYSWLEHARVVLASYERALRPG